MKILYIVGSIWVAWLLIDGVLTGGVWVKGGAKDRFTRDLDMHSFATKMRRDENPSTYWLVMVLYLIFLSALIYLGFFNKA